MLEDFFKNIYMDKSDLLEVKLVINFKVFGKCWYKRY